MLAHSRFRRARTCGRSRTSTPRKTTPSPPPCASACAPPARTWGRSANKYNKEAQPIPLTMCFGVPPACTLLAGAGFDYAILPMGCDEIGIAGAAQGRPTRMVKAPTADAYTLADAELVLEGHIHPRDRRFDTNKSEDAGIQGRFHFHPEWAGYMGKAYKAPT